MTEQEREYDRQRAEQKRFAEMSSDVGELVGLIEDGRGGLMKRAASLDAEAAALRKATGGTALAKANEETAGICRKAARSMEHAGELARGIAETLDKIASQPLTLPMSRAADYKGPAA